jgi:hypothetical protein
VDEPPRLGPIQTVAAWLHIWTPPKGAEVPPVPWAKLALATLLLAAALGAVAAAIVPVISRTKEEHAERERRARAAERAVIERRLVEEGRLRTGAASRPTDAAGLTRGEALRERRRLVASLEGAIARDARSRVRAGKLKGPILAVRCTIEPPSQRFIERDLSRRAARYECTAITRVGRGFVVGHPFRARVDYRGFTYSWRKNCLPPGEGAARLAC